MPFDPKIHHRRSIRLQGYDYSAEGLYFITICTQDKRCLFGRIVDEEMILNDMGKIVEQELMNTNNIRTNMDIYEYIIMPNHIHFIIQITNNISMQRSDENQTKHCSHNIGAMVRGFKGSVTKRIGRSIWQRNYYEHIIRNIHSYEEIRNYICTNPQRWATDCMFAHE